MNESARYISVMSRLSFTHDKIEERGPAECADLLKV